MRAFLESGVITRFDHFEPPLQMVLHGFHVKPQRIPKQQCAAHGRIKAHRCYTVDGHNHRLDRLTLLTVESD